MIRVTIEIVPFGTEENKKRVLELILIGNITPDQRKFAKYIVKHREVSLEISHDRREGALVLVSKALNELLDHNPPKRIRRLYTPYQIRVEALDEVFTDMIDKSVHTKEEDAPHAPRTKLLRLSRRPSRSRSPTEGKDS